MAGQQGEEIFAEIQTKKTALPVVSVRLNVGLPACQTSTATLRS